MNIEKFISNYLVYFVLIWRRTKNNFLWDRCWPSLASPNWGVLRLTNFFLYWRFPLVTALTFALLVFGDNAVSSNFPDFTSPTKYVKGILMFLSLDYYLGRFHEAAGVFLTFQNSLNLALQKNFNSPMQFNQPVNNGTLVNNNNTVISPKQLCDDEFKYIQGVSKKNLITCFREPKS